MKPLSGVRVLDFSRYIAGPLSTMYLAEFGAEVVKVESPGRGDDSRNWEPIKDGVSGYFSAFNRSKKSVTLDLKKEKHREVIYQIVNDFDVVVCNFSPGVSKRLGIDYETLSNYNDRIIYCDITGFGQSGPYKTRKGFDTIFQAMGGIMSLTGTGDGNPVKAGIPIADYSGAFFSTISILLSLYNRERTNQGEYIDLSLYDSVVNLLPLALAFYNFTGEIINPMGTAHPGRVPSNSFKTKDQGFVQISVTDQQWFKFCEIIGISEEVANDEKYNTNNNRVKHREKILQIISDHVNNLTKEEIVTKCAEAGIPCGPVNNLEDILNDEQLALRNVIQSYNVEDKELDVYYINFPSKFKNMTTGMKAAPPKLGEHSIEVLQELLDADEKAVKEYLS